ncbi:uncharacterized protein PHALS_11681 [Plasmopara halstedii]|uniref:Uncharacterized protein n=1 Tax=Plasmopara halstedii TaxID=4781 RepID=A0A0P1AKH8_PLAHL|nr:uncharacterized protein PHALS_11681 [Plasmopara halstedii]CEG41329.1 hypothetical protein PHALS_11681 [Plasmopara halstedii]|eukprot:XP_024577698.1 hypothetical protein PHALS_11681 [Plasmopara halstedii]
MVGCGTLQRGQMDGDLSNRAFIGEQARANEELKDFFQSYGIDWKCLPPSCGQEDFDVAPNGRGYGTSKSYLIYDYRQVTLALVFKEREGDHRAHVKRDVKDMTFLTHGIIWDLQIKEVTSYSSQRRQHTQN